MSNEPRHGRDESRQLDDPDDLVEVIEHRAYGSDGVQRCNRSTLARRLKIDKCGVDHPAIDDAILGIRANQARRVIVPADAVETFDTPVDVARELGLDWHTVKSLEKQYKLP